MTVLAAAGVAARMFRDQFDRQTASRRVRGHAIVCGLGRVGPSADSALRTRPDLLPWPDASDAARAYTCNAIADYPRLLAQLGYEVRSR